jgi:quercetin dioxygenase-like cupin family protein
MRRIRADEVESEAVTTDNEGNPAKNTAVQVMIPEGPNFVLRVSTVESGGHTPKHTHPFEHEVYVLSGNGQVEGEQALDLVAGDAVYVPPNELHRFVNTGDQPFRFICVVPKT